MPHIERNLLRERDAADLIGVSDATLQKWRWRGVGPRYIKLGARAVRYRLSDIQQFVASGLVSTRDQG